MDEGGTDVEEGAGKMIGTYLVPSIIVPPRILPVELASAYDLEVSMNADAAKRAAILRTLAEQKANRKGSLTSRWSRETVLDAVTIYPTNAQAARALGMSSGAAFGTLCRTYGIESPSERKKRVATK